MQETSVILRDGYRSNKFVYSLFTFICLLIYAKYNT